MLFLFSRLRDRFGATYNLTFYTQEDIEKILSRSAKLLNVKAEPDALTEIAKRARRTPRVANRLLRRVRDYAQVRADGRISAEVADQALQMLEVDRAGLDTMDKRILNYIMEECDGGPVGVSSLAVGVGEDAETIEEVYEPYLIQRGFIKRTSSGRVLTRLAYEHFNRVPPAASQELF